VAELYEADLVEFPHLGHFDLVLHPEPRRAIADFLGTDAA
jgi:hypothetical protein